MTALFWSSDNPGLTVIVENDGNISSYGVAPVAGVPVTAQSTIAVMHSDPSATTTFTLTDSQNYLKPGSVMGDLLENTTNPTYQRIITGYAEFLNLKSELTINPTSAGAGDPQNNDPPATGVIIPVKKTLGRYYAGITMPAVFPDFRFQLVRVTDETGASVHTEDPFTQIIFINGAGDGYFHLDNLTEGTYYYRITELELTPEENRFNWWTIDYMRMNGYIVKVEVPASGAATYTIISGEAEVIFNNMFYPKSNFHYSDIASISIEKEVLGIGDTYKEFTFELTYLGKYGPTYSGEPTDLSLLSMTSPYSATKTIRGPGTVTFNNIGGINWNYVPGSAWEYYYYKITEVPGPSGGGWEYSDNELIVIIRLSSPPAEGGAGAPVVTKNYWAEFVQSGSKKFTNTYSGGNVTVPVNKAITGGGSPDKQFRFNLTEVADAAGTPVSNPYTDTKTITGAGALSFALRDLELGTYFYEITEESGTSDGWDYSTNAMIVQVDVTEPAVGAPFAATWTLVSGSDTFTNHYTPPVAWPTKGKADNITANIGFRKTIGGGVIHTDEVFTFKLLQVKNAEGDAYDAGSPIFESRTIAGVYSETGEIGNFKLPNLTAGTAYYFKAWEASLGKGWSCEKSEYIVTVSVSNEGAVSYSVDGGTVTASCELAFLNIYTEPEPQTKHIRIRKTLGDGVVATDEVFTFNLTRVENEEGDPYTGSNPISETAVINGVPNGAGATASITLENLEPDTYYFRVTEESVTDWTIASEEYTVKVEIFSDAPTVYTYNGTTTTGTCELAFLNTYDPPPQLPVPLPVPEPGVAHIRITKTLGDGVIATNEIFTFTLTQVENENGDAYLGGAPIEDSVTVAGVPNGGATADITVRDLQPGRYYFRIREEAVLNWEAATVEYIVIVDIPEIDMPDDGGAPPEDGDTPLGDGDTPPEAGGTPQVIGETVYTYGEYTNASGCELAFLNTFSPPAIPIIPKIEPEPTPTPTPIPEPTPTPTPIPEPTPTPTPIPEPTPTPIPEPTPMPTPIPEPTPTPTPIPESTPIPIPTQEPEPESTPIPIPTQEPEPEYTPEPTPEPTPVPPDPEDEERTITEDGDLPFDETRAPARSGEEEEWLRSPTGQWMALGNAIGEGNITLTLEKNLANSQGFQVCDGAQFAVRIYDENYNLLARQYISANGGSLQIPGVEPSKIYYIAEEQNDAFETVAFIVGDVSENSKAIGIRVVPPSVNMPSEVRMTVENATDIDFAEFIPLGGTIDFDDFGMVFDVASVANQAPKTGDNMLLGAMIAMFIISSAIFVELIMAKKRVTENK